MGPGPGPGNGGVKIHVFDQKENPDNKRAYTADVFVQHKDGTVMGPYKGSSFPNAPDSQYTQKTVKEGTYSFNNKYGHLGGSKKGLNLVDEQGDRNTSATTTPGGSDATAKYVNVHSGEKPNAAGLQNRGSAACITLHPDDVESFWDNFDWSGEYNGYSGNSGNSTGTISIYRGEGEGSSTMRNYLETAQEIQNSLPKKLTLPLVQSDATKVVLPVINL